MGERREILRYMEYYTSRAMKTDFKLKLDTVIELTLAKLLSCGQFRTQDVYLSQVACLDNFLLKLKYKHCHKSNKYITSLYFLYV